MTGFQPCQTGQKALPDQELRIHNAAFRNQAERRLVGF
jgi:hypothetical protein